MAKINKTPDFLRMVTELMKDARIYAEKEGVGFFTGSFKNEGFTDVAFEPWQKRKDSLDYKVLQRTAYLKNSVQVFSSSNRRIVFGSDAEYAEIHNNGGTVQITVTPKARKYFWFMYKATGVARWKWMALSQKEQFTFIMPKRQFIGESATFMKQLNDWMTGQVKKRFKQLK